MLSKWAVALGERSKYAAEFGNLKKVACLLSSNGFPLPKPKEEDVEAIAPTPNLDLITREEAVREERLYYEARLEDHLAKGAPADLKAANELMKVLAGYDPEEYSKVDGMIGEGLDRLEGRVRLLEELLINVDASQWESDETIQAVYGECKSLLPKLLRLADSDLESGTMNRILALNEELQRVMRLREDPEQQNLLQLGSEDVMQLGTEEDLPYLVGSPQKDFDLSTDVLALYNKEAVVADCVRARYWLAEDLLVDHVQVGEAVSLVRVSNLGPDLVQQVSINDAKIPILLSGETTAIAGGAFKDLQSLQLGDRNLSFTELSRQ